MVAPNTRPTPLSLDEFKQDYYRDGFNRIIKKDGIPVTPDEHAALEGRLQAGQEHDVVSAPVTTAPRGDKDFGNSARVVEDTPPQVGTPVPLTAGVINTTHTMHPAGYPAKTDEDGGIVDPKIAARP